MLISKFVIELRKIEAEESKLPDYGRSDEALLVTAAGESESWE